MTNIIVELESSEYERLSEEAKRLGKTPDDLVQEWVSERLKKSQSDQLDNKKQTIQALRAAGLLAEISPGLRKLADLSIPLEEVQQALSRDKNGKSLSQIVIEGRGPKD
jgi:hypothetical protein